MNKLKSFWNISDMLSLEGDTFSPCDIFSRVLDQSQAVQNAVSAGCKLWQDMELRPATAPDKGTSNLPWNHQTPVYSLPEEILSDILQMAHTTQSVAAHEFVENLGPAIELSASQVTKRWRDIAIHNPMLWKKICLPQSSGHIESYLCRSQGLLLDIVIKEGTSRSAIQKLCRLLNPFSTITLLSFSRTSQLSSSQNGYLSRLRQFVIDGTQCSAASVQDVIRCINSADTPNLTELELSAPWQSKGNAIDMTYRNRAPHLRAVVLNGVKFADCIGPLEHLKAVRLWEYPAPLFILAQTLNTMVNLVHLQLDLSVAFNDQEIRIILPALLELHLSISKSEKLPQFLVLLDAPLLTCLSVASLTATALDETCMNLCPTRFPMLKELIFQENGSFFTEGSLYWTDFVSYATAFPSIHRLEVAMVMERFITTILECMNPSTLQPCWPALHTLAIQRHIDIPIIASALARRKSIGSPIQRLLLKQGMPDSGTCGETVELLPYVDLWPAHWPSDCSSTR